MQGNPSPQSSFSIKPAIAILTLLFVFAIPWWWQFLPDVGGKVVLGAPLWFVTSIGGSLLVSLVTARYLSRAWALMEAEEEPVEAERGHE